MKTEAQIRNLLEYIESISDKGFSDNTFDTYVSPVSSDEDGEQLILEGKEAGHVLSNINIVVAALEWVLEQPDIVKYPENENELIDARRRGLRIGVDGKGKYLIPDTSHTEFIRAYVEGGMSLRRA